MKSNPAKKTLEQCFLVKTKPTCQKSAIFEHFQKWPKTKGTFLPAALQFSVNLKVQSNSEKIAYS